MMGAAPSAAAEEQKEERWVCINTMYVCTYVVPKYGTMAIDAEQPAAAQKSSSSSIPLHSATTTSSHSRECNSREVR